MTKQEVKNLQTKLNSVLNMRLSIDGDLGPMTKQAIRMFQTNHKLTVDGIAGPKTLAKLNEVYNGHTGSNLIHFGKRRFVVFVDAGHGGIDNDGQYTTKGKRMYHEGQRMHENGHYYEGYENRLIAEAFIEALTDAGIMCVRTYDPTEDWSLSKRTKIVRDYLKRGYYGYLHSFHSNAISLNHTAEKLNDTKGFIVFSTREDNFSDKIATQHFNNVKEIIGADKWRFRSQDSEDNDPDYEANFQILRETDLSEFKHFGAILEEWGFFTSLKDCNFIINPKTRQQRVMSALKTAQWVKLELDKQIT